MATLRFKVITPERVTAEGEADSLSAMTETGEITVLPNHIPLATLLRPGEMLIKHKDKERILAVAGGMLQVMPGNEIVILAEEAYLSEELELSKVEEAKRKAEEALLKIERKEEASFADAAAHLERELVKYRVAMKGRARKNTPPPAP